MKGDINFHPSCCHAFALKTAAEQRRGIPDCKILCGKKRDNVLKCVTSDSDSAKSDESDDDGSKQETTPTPPRGPTFNASKQPGPPSGTTLCSDTSTIIPEL